MNAAARLEQLQLALQTLGFDVEERQALSQARTDLRLLGCARLVLTHPGPDHHQRQAAVRAIPLLAIGFVLWLFVGRARPEPKSAKIGRASCRERV